MNLGYELLKLWVLWYSSAAFCGAFFGVLAALGVRSLFNKVVKLIKSRR